MEVQLDFLIDDSTQTFNKAVRFVVGFALAFDVFQGCSRKDRK